jgi:hypothetical protein
VSVTGIFDSLVATAIWAALAYSVYRLRRRFARERRRADEAGERVRRFAAAPLPHELHLNAVLFLQVSRQALTRLMYGQAFAVICELVLLTSVLPPRRRVILASVRSDCLRHTHCGHST